MIGLDTNVLVRYIMQDDATQARLATKLVESLTVEAPGYVPQVALVELVWVLSSSFGLSQSQVGAALEGLLQTKEIRVENADVAWQALRRFRASAADFADCLIERAAAAAGCRTTMTFDKGAVKNCNMALVQETA